MLSQQKVPRWGDAPQPDLGAGSTPTSGGYYRSLVSSLLCSSAYAYRVRMLLLLIQLGTKMC